MKKIYWFAFIALLFALYPFCSLAQPGDQFRPQNDLTTAGEEGVSQETLGSDVTMARDGFGGALFVFFDDRGNKHVTNSAELIPRDLVMAKAEDSSGSNQETQPVIAQETPMMICQSKSSDEVGPYSYEPVESEDLDAAIYDPLESVNRVFFHFNDKLYFWFIKPVATGYKKIMPEEMRVGFRNFFSNVAMPIRAANCLLQFKLKGFVTEIARFIVNSTVGGLGFGDPAKEVFNLQKQEEDFGQTLGYYGLGPLIYIDWPVLGPSSIRGTLGLAGDYFMDPIVYFLDDEYSLGVIGFKGINKTSLTIGDYEALKESAIDPYISLRNAYYQHRRYMIQK